MADMTALELAQKIAEAVLRDAYDSGDGFGWNTVPKRTQAVLKTLRDTGHWFSRLQGEPLGNEPSVQLPLELV